MEHPHVAAFFAEHEQPTHIDTRAVSEAITTVNRLIAAMRKQTIEYRAKLDEVAHNDPPPLIVGELERLYQNMQSFDRELNVLQQGVREIGQIQLAFERFMADIKQSAARAASFQEAPS